MKILIHGRKNGYTVLFPKPTPTEFYSFASDIQSISANNYDVYYGKYFYTLAFVDGGCVFTKYVIGDDVERGQLGEIGISVFIPNTQKISGVNIKTLLDELINTYCRSYISDNKINEPKNGFDWPLFTSLANGYDSKLLRSANYDHITTGTKDPAFHYYKSESELIEHLDKPFQEEYSNFRQILFIDSNLHGAANPLNVIRNSGIELNPDLNNEYYYLNNYNSSKGIKITANGKSRSEKKGENKIRAKWQVEIKYSKDDRCYESISAHGTISDLFSEIHKYLEIKGNHIMLKYDAFKNPRPKIKSVAFEIKDQNGKFLEGAEIQIGTRPLEKVNESTTTVNFQGEEIIKQWIIYARKESENLHSNKIYITPFTNISSVVLTLQKQIGVKIFAKDNENGNNIPNFRFRCNDGKGFRENVTEIIFTNDEIDKTWTIEVSKEEGQTTYLGKIEYCPATGENPLHVPCQKTIDVPSQNKTYKIDAGEHGKKSKHCPGYSNSSSGNDLGNNCIIANKGYAFKKWELKNDTLVALYEKTIYFYQNRKFIAGTITSALVLCVGIMALFHFLGKDKEPHLNSQQITAYVEGDSLMLEKLEDYKNLWEKQKPTIEISGGVVWYNPTTWFVGSNEANRDSTKYKEWDKSSESLDRAISIRNWLTNKNFAELKNQGYFSAQHSFETAIEKIDSSKYAEVGTMLDDVSALTLTQIADSINAILSPKEQKNQAEPNMGEMEIESTQRFPRPDQRQIAPTDHNTEIERDLQSATITKQKLKEYSEANLSNLKGSIKLYNDFWTLVEHETQKKSDYDELLNKVKQDITLRNSELMKFLDSISSSAAFEKFNNVRGRAICNSLTELKDKIK